MLKVGITGGIGSGKSIVCQVFNTLGIPVFNADEAARYLMENDATLIAEIKALFGNDVYENNKLNSSKLSAIVFNEPEKLRALNELVHPATITYAKKWQEQQTTAYTIKEAAIFFEAGSYTDMDIMIGVSAPMEIRINRTIKRSGLSREEVIVRINKQMNEEEKMKRCDYVIINDDNTAVLPQVLALNSIILERAKNENIN